MKLDPQADALSMLAIGSSSSFKHLGLPDSWGGVFRFGLESFAVANVARYSDDLKKPSIGRHILLHEYQHYLSRFSITKKQFPLWFEEGKAEYYATFKYDGKNIYIGNPQAIMFRSMGLFSRSGSFEIDSKEIFERKTLPLQSQRLSDLQLVERFYARSFFIVHYLYSTMELRQSMANYLSQVLSGKTEEDALKSAFNQSFDEFDKNVIDYVKRNLSMRVLSVKDGNFVFPEVIPEIKILTKDEARGRLTYFVRELGLE